VQRLAERVQRQRLHVVFDVRPGWRATSAVKAPSCDGAMLIGPLRFSAYSSADHRLAPQELASVLSVLHAVDTEDGADLQVVLQVGAHAGQVQPRLDAVRLQQRSPGRCPTAAASAACRCCRRTGPPRGLSLQRAPGHAGGSRPARPAAQAAVGAGAEQQPRDLGAVSTCRLGRRMQGPQEGLGACSSASRGAG
jgi:hypothetical protein